MYVLGDVNNTSVQATIFINTKQITNNITKIGDNKMRIKPLTTKADKNKAIAHIFVTI